MPYHPSHHRLAAWHVVLAALVVGLLAAVYLLSFRASPYKAGPGPDKAAPIPTAVSAPVPTSPTPAVTTPSAAPAVPPGP